jgi:creatinine amidohydrolase
MDFTTVETSARVREWQYMTGREIDALDRKRTVVMLACSPLEVHGPHLPVITDNLEAEGLSLRTMEIMCERHPELEFVHLPPLYTAADVLPHVGSVMFRPSTIVRVLADIGRSLGKQGFKHIWVSSFHGGPRHFVPLEVAAHQSNKKHGTEMVSLFSLLAKLLAGGGSDLTHILGGIKGLTPAEIKGDAHGGAIETSMMLYLLGKYVDPCFKDLDQRTVDMKLAKEGKPPLEQGKLVALLRGFKHKIKYYEDETYSGKPSIASAAIGEKIVDELATRSADVLGDRYTGKLPISECHSPVWPMRHVFMSERFGWAFERAIQYKNRVF